MSNLILMIVKEKRKTKKNRLIPDSKLYIFLNSSTFFNLFVQKFQAEALRQY